VIVIDVWAASESMAKISSKKLGTKGTVGVKYRRN